MSVMKIIHAEFPPNDVQTFHYETFSVVRLGNGLSIHFSETLSEEQGGDHVRQANEFAENITNPHTEAKDMWLDNVDLRVERRG